MSQTSYKNLISCTEAKPVAFMKAFSLVIAVSLSLGACATDSSPKSNGERISDRGSEIGGYGTAWSEGQAAVQRAEKAIRKTDQNRAEGERDLERAREKLAKAEQKIRDASKAKTAALKRIEDGRAQMIQAEEDYARTKAGPSAVDPEDGSL